MVLTRRSAGFILALIILLIVSAFSLLAFREETVDPVAFAFGGGLCALILIIYNVLSRVFKHIDRFVLIICAFLWGIGMATLYRINPEYAFKQFIWIAAGAVVMVIALLIIQRAQDFGRLNWLFLFAAAGLLAAAFLFARVVGGAKNWITIGEFTFQPSEFAKVLFIVVSAYFFSQRRKRLNFLPYLFFTAFCVVILVVSKDLGAALLYSFTFLTMFYAATGRLFLTIGGLGVATGGAFLSYKLFSHVKTRVDIWINPWETYQTQGYQIVQGLMAIASGGLLGAGLGLGYPSVIPANSTDFIFAVICEEFGIIAGVCVIIFYLVLIIRGFLIALNAKTRFDALLVFGCTAMLSLQSFIIIAGVIKLIPLTGITMPFVSYGGSSMLSSLALVGMIQGVAVKNGREDEEELNKIGGEML